MVVASVRLSFMQDLDSTFQAFFSPCPQSTPRLNVSAHVRGQDEVSDGDEFNEDEDEQEEEEERREVM